MSFRSLLAAMLAFAAVPAAAAVPDCPLAAQPYSTRSPMLDIMLDPRAKAVLDREAPDLVSTLTRNFGGGDLPRGFAAITTLQFYLRMRPDGAELGRKLDAALARIPLTEAAMLARCARYDQVPLKLPATIGHPAILVFEKINGFRNTYVAHQEQPTRRVAEHRLKLVQSFTKKCEVARLVYFEQFDDAKTRSGARSD